MSLFDPEAFLELPEVPSSELTDKGAVVFLISPMAGALLKDRRCSQEDAILHGNSPFRNAL